MVAAAALRERERHGRPGRTSMPRPARLTKRRWNRGEQRRRIEHAADERVRVRQVGQQHAAQQRAHVVAGGRAELAIEQRLHRALRQRHRGDEVGHHLDRAQRDLGGIDGVDGGRERAVARDQREAVSLSSDQRAPKRCVSSTARPTATRRPSGGARPALTATKGLIDTPPASMLPAERERELVQAPPRSTATLNAEPVDARHDEAVAASADARRRRATSRATRRTR